MTQQFTHKCIWEHIINSNNIDLHHPLSLLTSEDIKKCNKTWQGKKTSLNLDYYVKWIVVNQDL